MDSVIWAFIDEYGNPILAHPNNVNVRSLVDAVQSAHREAGQVETQHNLMSHPNPEESGPRR